MEIMKAGGVDIRNWATDLDDNTRLQLGALSRLPIMKDPIASMPDAHMGKGAAVGSVIVTRNALIPSAVGVDIGCGMLAVKTSLSAGDMPDSLKSLRLDLEKAIPLGPGGAYQDDSHLRTNGAIKSLLSTSDDKRLNVVQGAVGKRSDKGMSKAVTQLGTLGSGNHFIELCLDENRNVWIMLHSGSRGIGNMIGSHFIEKAMKRADDLGLKLEDKNLAWLESSEQDFHDYWAAMSWAQDYAMQNRQVMLDRVIKVMQRHFNDFGTDGVVTNCHHNYASLETRDGEEIFVTRKGAIRAASGMMGIIPGSMGTKSYIVRGLGNDESWCSCSHGAGRLMSRSKAKKAFTEEDMTTQTHGVECRKDRGVIDEIPGAYKDIDQVMANQKDLVEIVYTLKQIVCVKG